MSIQVGECRVEETPWRPDSSGPLTEEQATEKARQIMRVTFLSKFNWRSFHSNWRGVVVKFMLFMRYQDSWVEDCLSVVFASKIINAG